MSGETGSEKTTDAGVKKENVFRLDLSPKCPKCGITMKYAFGEAFQCPVCGYEERTDFGKVRAFLEKAGPQPAFIISEHTGVPVSVIDEYLRAGRVEIPDGSPVYIKCQSCGKDIRYGKYCPECAMRMSKTSGQITYVDMGECPTNKPDMSGKMHILDEHFRNQKR